MAIMSNSLSAIFIISAPDPVISEFTEVITSHSGKIGWRRPDGGRGYLAQTNTPGVADYRRNIVKMYEIKTRMITVTPKRSVVEG